MPTVLDDTPGDQFMEEIKQKKDKWEDTAREAVKTADSSWEEHNGFLTKDGLIYVLPTKICDIVSSRHTTMITWPVTQDDIVQLS
jgi:hypothetical protein